MLKRRPLYFGDVTRMVNERYPRVVLQGYISGIRRNDEKEMAGQYSLRLDSVECRDFPIIEVREGLLFTTRRAVSAWRVRCHYRHYIKEEKESDARHCWETIRRHSSINT